MEAVWEKAGKVGIGCVGVLGGPSMFLSPYSPSSNPDSCL